MSDSWYDLYCEEVEKNEKLKKELKQAKAHALSLERRLAYMEKNQEKMEETAECVCKDEFDFEVVLKKKRHRFVEMRCRECGHVERAGIPKHLKEENQYEYGVQALALTLMNEGYVSMARTKGIIEGITNNEMRLSVGYITKLQKRLYGSLAGFHEELRRSVSRLPIVHWDDTVIMIDTKRACLRIYGDEKTAYYPAHMHKDKAGLDEDRILGSLDAGTYVVHDHNKINYNEEYAFQNVECCVHVLRDMKKVVDNLKHEWAKQMIGLFVRENHRRREQNELNYGYISLEYDSSICLGYLENTEDEEKYYAETEAALLKRLKEYKENYLMWACNEKIPFSNNVSERSLRSSKTKMKVSGQFNNIETGHRHGMNSMYLIKRALEHQPVTFDEMKKYEADND